MKIGGLEEAETIVFFSEQDSEGIHPVDDLKRLVGINGRPSFTTGAATGENLIQAFLSMRSKLASRLQAEGMGLI